MKSHFLLIAVLIGGCTLARAEDIPVPSPTPLNSLMPEQAGATDPLQAPNLMPPVPAVSPAPEASVPPATQTSFKKGTAEQLRQSIQIRELRTVVEQDPEVIAQKATAQIAKTEEGRRVAMRNYYTLLYTKIEKLDPSLQPVLERQLHDVLTRYEQHNVCPTSVLIEPIDAIPGSDSADHEIKVAKSSASPEPTPKKKEKKPKK